MKKMQRKKIVRTSLYIGLIIIICGFVADIAFHFYLKKVEWQKAVTQFDPLLGWKPIPNLNVRYQNIHIKTNSFGFRSDPILPNKRHVLVIGDSVAWGHDVSNNETLTHFLQENLSDSNYQVHNLAVNGYGVGQSYLRLKEALDHFDNIEAVILVVFSYNDLENTRSNSAYGKRKPLFRLNESGEMELVSVPIKKYCARNVLSYSPTLSALSEGLPFIGPWITRNIGDIALSRKEGARVTAQVLQEIRELVLGHNARFVIVLSPSSYDFIEKTDSLKWFEAYFEKNKKQFIVINLFDYFKQHVGELTRFFYDWGHYTPQGNQMVAELIEKQIK